MISGVKIVNVGLGASGTKVINAVTGDELTGVSSIVIMIKPNDIVKAAIEIDLMDVSVEAVPEFLVCNPETGKFKKISCIEFDDGTVFEP